MEQARELYDKISDSQKGSINKAVIDKVAHNPTQSLISGHYKQPCLLSELVGRRHSRQLCFLSELVSRTQDF